MLTSDANAPWTITYYSPRVRREIFDLPKHVLADFWQLGAMMRLYGPNLRMPHSRALGDGLFELRPHGREGIGRVFYCAQMGRRILILHSFVKKTRRTPDTELRVARNRLSEVRAHG